MPQNSFLFESSSLSARVLAESDIPRLQALFTTNPEYFFAINGLGPTPDAAQIEFDERPPSHLSYSEQICLGLFNRRGALSGVAIVVQDLGAKTVWHLSLFLIATALQGNGVGSEIYVAFERWMKENGAHWIRLGVVQGNSPAERFWEKHEFSLARKRENVDTGGRLNTVCVKVKPLFNDALSTYFVLVPRDRPDSNLI
jgi:GNAT superfamily N-acetyltransferase